jgi:large subunit ribosomal protein L23
MALFGRKQAPKKSITEKKETAETRVSASFSTADVLRNPRITEKASVHMSVGIYAFDIAETATKRSVMHAIYELYKVRPRAVHIVNIPRKMRRSTRTGKKGMTGGGKKAYVYLKKGETITLT